LFAGLEEQPYDRELFELDARNMAFDELIDFMSQRFHWTNMGMAKLVQLTKLGSNMLRQKYKILDERRPLWWSILVDLSVTLIPDMVRERFLH